MGGGRELDWDDEVDSSLIRTVATASPFADAWDDGGGGLDFDDLGETEIGTPLEDLAGMDRSLPIGTLVAERYVIDGKLGRGAMGVVYDASHISTRRKVALKYLDPAAATAPQALKRFFRESQIAALVKHPNVVEVFDGGRFGQSFFLAMERLEGRTLSDAIEGGPLEINEVVELFIRIADGVAAVHEHGVIHRDLKPDNIFLTAGERLGQPKVLDFGVSKLKEPSPGAAKLTMTGQVMGTPHYMGPEQFADASSVDARADVYSLGAMLYEGLAGVTPHEGDNVLSIYRQASEGLVRPLREHRPDVSPQLAAVVQRAMMPEPNDRYPSVVAMREALAELAAGGTALQSVAVSSAPVSPVAVPLSVDHALAGQPVASAAPSRLGLIIGIALAVVFVICAAGVALVLFAR